MKIVFLANLCLTTGNGFQGLNPGGLRGFFEDVAFSDPVIVDLLQELMQPEKGIISYDKRSILKNKNE